MRQSLRIGDVLTIERGTTYKSALLDKPGPNLLGLGTIQRHGGFRSDSLRTYGGDSPEKLLVRPGELYASLKDVTQTADLLGAVARVPKDGQLGRLTQDTVRLDIFSQEVSPDYIYWVLRSPQYREYCRAHATGTTTMGLSREDFFSFKFPAPDTVRMTLIKLLDALDGKIAVNGEAAKAADKLAHWHFRAAIGSEVSLSSLARFVNGKAFTKDATGTGRVVIRIAELNSGISGSTVYNDIEVPDDHLARPGDLLFAWSGSLTAARWFRPEAIVNQHIFKVLPKPGVPMWLVNQAVHAKLGEFKAIAADKATTMGHIQRRHLDKPVFVPNAKEAYRIDGLMTGLWNTALAVEVETLKIAQTRDELLPLLMSGNVSVRDAEQTIEAVT